MIILLIWWKSTEVLFENKWKKSWYFWGTILFWLIWAWAFFLAWYGIFFMNIAKTWAFFKWQVVRLTSVLIMPILISIIFDSDVFVTGRETSNLFLSELLKLLRIAFSNLVFSILSFRLFLFIRLFLLLYNLFGTCKKSVISFFEPFFINFWDIVSFSILIAVISVGNLD